MEGDHRHERSQQIHNCPKVLIQWLEDDTRDDPTRGLHGHSGLGRQILSLENSKKLQRALGFSMGQPVLCLQCAAIWDVPLAVCIHKNSASSSKILTTFRNKSLSIHGWPNNSGKDKGWVHKKPQKSNQGLAEARLVPVKWKVLFEPRTTKGVSRIQDRHKGQSSSSWSPKRKVSFNLKRSKWTLDKGKERANSSLSDSESGRTMFVNFKSDHTNKGLFEECVCTIVTKDFIRSSVDSVLSSSERLTVVDQLSEELEGSYSFQDTSRLDNGDRYIESGIKCSSRSKKSSKIMEQCEVKVLY